MKTFLIKIKKNFQTNSELQHVSDNPNFQQTIKSLKKKEFFFFSYSSFILCFLIHVFLSFFVSTQQPQPQYAAPPYTQQSYPQPAAYPAPQQHQAPPQYPPQQAYPAQPQYPPQQAYPAQYPPQPQIAYVQGAPQPHSHTTITVNQGPYSTSTALIGSVVMSCAFGIHGFHRCYVGDGGLGFLQCITCGGCWIWSIIDWLNMDQIVNDANARSNGGVKAIATTTTYR